MARRAGSAIAAFVTGRLGAWLVVLIAVLASGALIGGAGKAYSSNASSANLPVSIESARAAALQQQLPSSQSNPALVVYARGGEILTTGDRAAIQADRVSFGPIAVGGPVSPAIYSTDGRAALVAVPLPADVAGSVVVESVTSIRAVTQKNLPAGLTAQVTGGAGFVADINNAFAGADLKLLIVTAAVVALLLLVTYRSPILWLVPLLVVGTADQVASSLIAVVSRAADLQIDPATSGIVQVLVFGAGTDYALLLIARYREELRHVQDERVAMRRALSNGGPAIAGSAVTVVLSLLTLLFATLTSNRALGVAGAIGIAVAATFGLLVLPAALVVCKRGVFWPFIPRVGDVDHARTGAWARLGGIVSARPWPIIAGSIVVLVVLAAGFVGTNFGLSQTEQFRVKADSAEGLQTLGRYFPAGLSDPATVLTNPGAADAVLAAARATPGVASASISDRNSAVVQIEAVLKAAPDTPDSYAAIQALRDSVHAVPGGDALVGGSVAIDLDTRDAAIRDLKVVVPLVLLVVLLVLMLLLRAVVGPIVLVLTVVASFFAALGAGTWIFTHLLGFGGIAVSVPLLAFLFLVALGVDYNIFLTTRAREEAASAGTRHGIVVALAVTGGVITSAGILLAAVFGVLAVLPIIALTEIGIIVGLGVLLDTLLVRTVLVPALIVVLDGRFWWPGTPHSSNSTVPLDSVDGRVSGVSS
jgi:RND superfamily putative drug exporter